MGVDTCEQLSLTRRILLKSNLRVAIVVSCHSSFCVEKSMSYIPFAPFSDLHLSYGYLTTPKHC